MAFDDFHIKPVLTSLAFTLVYDWFDVHVASIADVREVINLLTLSDLIPYWIYEVSEGYSIERLIPMLPLSREVEFIERLKHSLVLYRSVIGQPRQQEFLEFLATKMDKQKIDVLLNQLIIDLSPQ